MLNRFCKNLILIIIILKINGGLTLTIQELNDQHSEEIIRQTKSEEIQKFLNEAIDPCEDFYAFCCGNFNKHTSNSADIFKLMRREMRNKLKTILESNDQLETAADKKVANFYKSCIKTSKWCIEYKDAFEEIIREIGEMPLLEGDKWQEPNFDWIATLAAIQHNAGLYNNIIFDIKVEMDFANNSLNRVYIKQPEFAFKDRAIYVDPALATTLQDFKNVLAYILESILEINKDLAKETAEEIMEFEIALAQAMTDPMLGLKMSEIYTLMPIDEMQKKYENFADFKNLINGIMGFTPDKLYVQNNYVDNALNIITKTSKKVLANYMYFTFIGNFISLLPSDEIERQRYCTGMSNIHFYKILDNMFYRKHVTPQMWPVLNSIWSDMKMTFGNILESQQLNWINASTKQFALEKLAAMKLTVLSYEHLNFTQEYEDLELNDHNYIENLKSFFQFKAKLARLKIQEVPQASDVAVLSSYTPFYSLNENAIKLPLQALQPFYLWSASYPMAYNMAALGSAIAHEMMHGFDDYGRNYDALGNERNWWDSESASEFEKRKKCFTDQYKSYKFGDQYLPERYSQSENIADNAGIHLAFETYLKTLAKNNDLLKEEYFPGLNYTNKQLFFISYGQSWCTHISFENIASQLATKVHAPDQFRVIGSLSNLEDFSKAFNCSKEAAMNPVRKCKIF